MNVGRSLLVASLGALVGLGCDAKKDEAAPAPAAPEKAADTKAPVAAPTPAAPPPAAPTPAAPTPAPASAKTTPELKALDEMLAPILAIADDDARSKAGCKALDGINTQIRAVDEHPPTGVDAAKWTEVVERMSGGLNDYAIECVEDSSANTKALTDLAEIRKELDAMIPK